MPESDPARRAVARAVARHSLGWLVLANLVGAWLATALLWPAAGDALAPLTYGRWMPLHLDWQLYGWCALPLVGVLLAWLIDHRHPQAPAHARVALAAWSVALALGGLSWLTGHSSGKLFVEWQGWARFPLPLAMILLWTVLAAHTWWRRRELSRAALAVRAIVLAALAAVPPLLFLAADRSYYPPVNPDSGGATGAALLGSTLALVTIFGALPGLLHRPIVARRRAFWPLLAGSWLVYFLIDRGATSHHSPAQIAALGLLLAWVPLLAWRWRGFQWTADVRPWLGAAFAWWLLLVVSGWVSFLPGFSERFKFTNALVAHAHLAMAGVVTAVNGLILQSLAGRMDRRGPFWLWQGGCVLLVLATFAAGWNEAAAPAGIFWSDLPTQALYGLRWLGGIAMTTAAVQWWVAQLRR